LLGLLVQASGNGGTELNAVYHRTVLAVLIVSLVLLLTRSGRVALRKSLHKTEYAVKSTGSDKHD
jgi:choline-glycine betaine transporter